MKSENLGIVHELPAPTKGLNVSLLILADEKAEQHSVLKAEKDGFGNDIWIDVYKAIVIKTWNFEQDYPNGAEAVLITFEPSE